MKISPLELVYTAAIICALLLGDTTQTLLGVALGGVLIARRSLHARRAHRSTLHRRENTEHAGGGRAHGGRKVVLAGGVVEALVTL